MIKDKPLGGDSNKFHGEYLGVVEDVDDPKKMLRVRVRVFSLFDDAPIEDLPWAEYRLPVGSRFNDGFFIPADVGDFVWLKFPYDGDTRRPVVIGSAHYAPNGKPNFPHESWCGDASHIHKRTGEEPEPSAHEYHKDVVLTQHGITVEMREDASCTVVQRDTGTEICIHPDGSIIIHGAAHLYFSSVNNTECITGENRSSKVSGDSQESVGGNATVKVAGDATHMTGGSLTIGVTGNTTITTPLCTINGNLLVKGNITASKDILDKNGAKSMSGMRSVYNGHHHATSPAPDYAM